MTDALTPARIREATLAGEILVCRCGTCGAEQAMPSSCCFNCGAGALSVYRHRGEGQLYSWVNTHTAFEKELEREVPYTVAVVRLTGGARVYARLVCDGTQTVTAEQDVRLDEAATRRGAFLIFRPVD